MANNNLKDKFNQMPPRQRPSAQQFPVWRILLWILVLWFVVLFFTQYMRPFEENIHEISYSQFKQAVRDENVEKITVEGETITGAYRSPLKEAVSGMENGDGDKKESSKNDDSSSEQVVTFERFTTVMPAFEDPNLMGLLEQKGVEVYAKPDETPIIWQILISLLPWILIIGFFVWSSRKLYQGMGKGAGGLFSFGKSRARMATKESVDKTYEDVAGLENAKKELIEVVEFLKDPSRFEALGGELPKGLLLVGPPGVGKTLLARATAGEADVPFFSISGSEFVEMFVGVGASRVRDMFKNAKNEAPSIIFVDEIDAIGRTRGAGLGGGHDEREQTLNQILAEMDGFSPREKVVVMAATNRPDVLDPALIRPGRFDRRIMLERPQKNARKEILKIHMRNMPVADDVDIDRISKMTVGFSGADLKNLVNEAALLAARKQKTKVTMEEFIQGRDKILMGIEREDVISDDEKKVIACHEAGHALVAFFLENTDPLEKVTIIPRGRAMGATEQIPVEERHNLGRQYLLNRLAVMLGGRAAEKVMYGDITTGAGDDLKRATQLARQMVCQWGMSEKLGPATFRQGEKHPFIGREITQQKDFSERTAEIIDEEIKGILDNMENKAIETLKDHKKELETVVDSLLENETLSREDLQKLIGV